MKKWIKKDEKIPERREMIPDNQNRWKRTKKVKKEK